MLPFTTLTGIAIPFGRAQVDTDLIIPGPWLKHLSKTGLAAGAFEALRQEPDNVFDRARNKGAPILIAGANFGCGSSREHACWALLDLGIRCVIAPDFADIFAGNAVKNGILLITLPPTTIDRLMIAAGHGPMTIDLHRQRIDAAPDLHLDFAIDPFRRDCLLNGWDEIDLTMAQAPAIADFATARAHACPWAVPLRTDPQVCPTDAQSASGPGSD